MRAERRTAASGRRRKRITVDREKLDRVVKLLGATTETQAIDRALDEVLARDEAITGLRSLSGRDRRSRTCSTSTWIL